MSTDYELVCNKHKERVDICTDGMSGPMTNCDRAMPAFCITHSNCSLNIVSEHDDSCDDYEEWALGNWKEKLNYNLQGE